ncbi:tetratricopeptide repeat protein [Altericroceibacterium spongiae]|uniref:Tetratricopeptide repeat protein n=1 Tax=Altericroceibacterium spongiae TaxID=2320269 RepID=A0A420EQZ8_9SPHN|nr:cellulose synthase subunit BcsC-related outer membrane protein [Altericroceibacterium spongiae]RKF23104.1 tetratricopeptide repeat protein [Altericroceibacterium spongiae]
MAFSRGLLLGTAIVVMASTPVPAIAQSQAVKTLLEQAEYWEQRGRRDRAIEAYRRVLAIDPDNATARRGVSGPPPQAAPPPQSAADSAQSGNNVSPPSRGATGGSSQGSGVTVADLAGRDRVAGFNALEAGRLSEAGRRFEAALARLPNDPDSLGGLGLVRLRTERFAEARDLLERASRRGSAQRWADALQSARFYAGLADARAAFDAGRLEEAEQATQQLVSSGFSDNAPAMELLAAIYEKQGRYQEAAMMSQRVAGQAQSGSQMARRSQVNSLRQQALAARRIGDNAGAERLFQQGLMVDRSDPWIRYEFARFQYAQGRLSETSSLINSLSQMNTPEAHYAAALLLENMDKPDQAEQEMSRIAASDRSAEMNAFMSGLRADAAINRARTIAAQGQKAQATTALYQIGANDNLPAGKIAEIANALYELGDRPAAAQLARKALEAEPRDIASYEPIVRILAQTGQEAFALSALQRVSERAGNSQEGTRLVARLNGIMASVQADQLREAGQYAQSFDLLQSAWSRAPGNIDILSALARLYQSGGLTMQATQTFRMVLQQSPDDKGALIGLMDSASAIGDNRLAGQALDQALSTYPQDYEIYLAAARVEQAQGDESKARRYLEQARSLYMRQTGIAQGGFPAANPFVNRRNDTGVGPAPVNPFLLGTNPDAAQASGGFAGAYDTGAPAYSGPAYPAQSSGNANGNFAGVSSYNSRSVPMRGNGGSAASAYNQPSYRAGSPQPDMPSQAAGSFGRPAASSSRQVASDYVRTGDPVLDSIQSDLNRLSMETGPRVDVQTYYRDRSGEEGLSALQDLGASAAISTGFAGGRISAKAKAVVVDAGRPTGSGLARFGRNGTPEAQAIVDEEEASLANADTQHASGVAVSVGYKNDLVEVDAGTTPLGFEKTRFAGGITVSPRFSPYASGRLWAERRPVTDSVLSYAGTRDPLSGEWWGNVMRTRGGASFSWDRDNTGFYADAAYSRFTGSNVRKNDGVEINLGGYIRAMQGAHSLLTIGTNANYQSYDNNQNYFTYGHGGYFSPQSFLSISFPVRYVYDKDGLAINVSASPGYQSYEQHGEALYPTDPAAQADLDALKTLNTDVRARYDTISQTGFGLAADGSVYYDISPRTSIGGEFNYNGFGDYNEFRTMIGVKQQIGKGN